MSAPLVSYHRCGDCSWAPDPKRRMAPENQAEEHTRQAGHVTHSGMEPKASSDE